MFLCVRTTIHMNDELFSMAKRYAVEKGVTFTALVEAGIRRIVLPSTIPSGSDHNINLPTFSGNGLQPGVDLDDGKSLRDWMDGIH